MVKHMVQWQQQQHTMLNQIVNGIASASGIVRVMLVSVSSDQINKEMVPY